MRFDPRSLVLFACNALLLYLTLLVNSSLAALNLHLFLLGPMIVIPALYLRHNAFFICTALSGLWVDAALPTTFGLFTFSFLIIGTGIYMIRHRFRAESNFHPGILAHGGNVLCLTLLTIWQGYPYFTQSAFWFQVLTTALLSHLCLLFLAPWFFNLERLLFGICRLKTDPEDLPIT